MIHTAWRDYHLSRLMLGTVQFGMPYGVANRTGQPDPREVLKIVKAAALGGVNCFDTAAAYGTSEEVLGGVLAELGIAERVVVVTKVRALASEELASASQAERAIEQSLAQSRKRLRIDCLPVVLFHREADGVYLAVLEKLKARGWLRWAGVSCDNRPGPAAHYVAEGLASALQIPGNLLDRRHQQSGIFEQSQRQGVAVFLRSVYLQGLLVMPEQEIPPALLGVIPVRRQLAAIAEAGGVSLAELALRYMLGQPGITCILAGVETMAQVQDNLAMFDRGPLPADLLAAVDRVAADLPELLITPSQWPARPATPAEAQPR